MRREPQGDQGRSPDVLSLHTQRVSCNWPLRELASPNTGKSLCVCPPCVCLSGVWPGPTRERERNIWSVSEPNRGWELEKQPPQADIGYMLCAFKFYVLQDAKNMFCLGKSCIGEVHLCNKQYP